VGVHDGASLAGNELAESRVTMSSAVSGCEGRPEREWPVAQGSEAVWFKSLHPRSDTAIPAAINPAPPTRPGHRFP
jgi:hypothetical protein